LDELLRRATGEFVHERHSAQSKNMAVTASVESQQYIELFWLHLTHAIQSDPEHLGLSLIKTGNAEPVSYQHYFRRLTANKDLEDLQFMRVASVLACTLTMADVLSDVTEKFAVSLQSKSHSGLPFDVISERFVSLRTLLSLKGYADDTSGNAPTLIMGGTDTAIKFYWNLLLRAANAFYELEERDPTREEMEALWEGSRELIFRIGSGSLTAFVALASACTDNASAPLWANTTDLSLMRNGDVYEWVVNDSFEQRFNNVFSKIKAKQQGEFVGCAALYTRVERLPLAVEASREQSAGDSTAFSELIRWIDTVARVNYFSKFPSGGEAN
jgi:hypothetical protein